MCKWIALGTYIAYNLKKYTKKNNLKNYIENYIENIIEIVQCGWVRWGHERPLYNPGFISFSCNELHTAKLQEKTKIYTLGMGATWPSILSEGMIQGLV